MTCKLKTFTIKIVKILPSLHARTLQRKNGLKIKSLYPQSNVNRSTRTA